MSLDSLVTSAITNVSGDPAVWRRVFWTTDWAPDNIDWKEGSYVDIMLDGSARVFCPHLYNGRTGDTDAHWLMNFFREAHWVNSRTGQVTGGPNNQGLNFRVYYHLQYETGTPPIWRYFPPVNDPNRGDADSFLVFRKVIEDRTPDPIGVIVPLPTPDV